MRMSGLAAVLFAAALVQCSKVDQPSNYDADAEAGPETVEATSEVAEEAVTEAVEAASESVEDVFETVGYDEPVFEEPNPDPVGEPE